MAIKFVRSVREGEGDYVPRFGAIYGLLLFDGVGGGAEGCGALFSPQEIF